MHRTADRGQAVAVAVVVLALVAPVAAVAVPPSSGTAAAQQARQVDSCRVIDAPGEYELAGDVAATASDACIHVAASDVVLDGNGHTVAGQNSSGTGVLVFRGEDAGSPADSLRNVTVRDLTAANWSNGVAVGRLDGGGTDVRLSDVVARENRYAGLRLVDVENATVRDVTAAGNGDGVTLWEVRASTLRDVRATGNGEHGVAFLQVARENTLRNLTATANGGDADRGAGVYLSTDTGGNDVVGAEIRDNDGVGVRFSDSFGNAVRDSVVAGNAEAGVFGVPAYEDALRNVTVRANGGPAVGHEPSEADSEFVADGLHLGDAASLSFPADPVNVERADAADLPEQPPRPLATEDGVALSGVENTVTTTLSVDDPADSSLWRYDGSGWQRVGDRRTDTDAGTVSGTVTGDGTVVALDAASQQDGDGSEEEGNESEEDGEENDADEAVGDGTLVVQADTADDFGYLFVVDGDAEGVETENVAADSGDSVVDSGDGTVTVVGSTGSNAGDAFEVEGEVVEFYTPAPAADYVLELDGEDVTDDVPEPNEDE